MKESIMANATQTATANTVDSAVFTNTTSGTLSTDRKGRTDFEPKRDRQGKLVYSTTLKAVTQQTDRVFPAVITADKVSAIVRASAKQKSPIDLLVEPGADYRLSKAPTLLEASEDLGLPETLVGFYKPIIVRNAVSF